MEPISVIAVVLFALLVGASLPVLFQAWRTLRSAQRFFDETAKEAGAAMREVAETADRMEKLIGSLEEPVRDVNAAIRAAGDLTRMLRSTQNVVRTAFLVGGAVGPAMAAAARALFAGGDDAPAAPPDSGDERDEQPTASGIPGGRE